MYPVVFLLLVMTTASGWAADHHPVGDLRAAAESFVRAQLPPPGLGTLEVEVGHLDHRLRLSHCGPGLETFVSSGNIGPGNLTVGLRCAGPNPWSLHVPVTVRLVTEVAVLVHPVSRGELLTADDVRLERRDVTRHHRGYFTDLAQVVGRELRRSSGAGQILSDLVVQQPLWVRRGERVALIAGSGSFEVRVTGKVLGDGGRGDRVRVKNLGSERVVEGVVVAPGRVRVEL